MDKLKAPHRLRMIRDAWRYRVRRWRGRLFGSPTPVPPWGLPPPAPRPPGRAKRWIAVAVFAAVIVPLIVIAAVVAFRLWQIPAWYLLSRGTTVPLAVATNEYRAALGPIFAVLVQLIGGLFVIGGLWLGWRQLSASYRQHITDRFDRSIEMLGSPQEVMRIASIHSLERLAHESESDRTSVIEALGVFTRYRCETDRDTWGGKLPHDIRAAIMSISRLGKEPTPSRPFDPEDADTSSYGAVSLAGVNFSALTMTGLTFRNFDLIGTRFDRADLQSVVFLGCRLRASTFHDARLHACTFRGCDLVSAIFSRAEISHTTFDRGHFECTSFDDSTITVVRFLWNAFSMPRVSARRARFQGADFKMINFNDINFSGATGLETITYDDGARGVAKLRSPGAEEPTGPYDMLPPTATIRRSHS